MGIVLQVRGELPLTKCRVALDAVNLAEPAIKEDTASLLADTIAHLGQEVCALYSHGQCCVHLCLSIWAVCATPNYGVE